MQITFHMFGAAHWAVLAVLPALAGLLALLQRKVVRGTRLIRWLLAALLLFSAGSYYAHFAWEGDRMFPGHVPLELCDLSLMLTIVVLVTPWVYPHLGNPAFGNTLWEKSTPVGAMDYIQQHQLQGNIFHPQVHGDYLIWRLWPDQRSFIDGRVHLFDDSVVRDYRLSFLDTHWAERLERYDIKYLLLSKDEPENRMIMETAGASQSWLMLYEDSVSVLFERTK